MNYPFIYCTELSFQAIFSSFAYETFLFQEHYVTEGLLAAASTPYQRCLTVLKKYSYATA